MHAQLIDMIEAQHPAILGEGNSNMPKLIRILAILIDNSEVVVGGAAAVAVGEIGRAAQGFFKDEDSYNSDLVDGPTRERVVALLRQIQSSMPAEALSQCVSPLDEDLQLALQRALA